MLKVLQAFKLLTKKKNLTVREVVDPALKKEKDMCLDWKLFQLVVFNLFQNAVKYNKESGKITIEMKLEENK